MHLPAKAISLSVQTFMAIKTAMLVPMADTITANYIFNSIVGVLDRAGVYWASAISL